VLSFMFEWKGKGFFSGFDGKTSARPENMVINVVFNLVLNMVNKQCKFAKKNINFSM